VSCVLNVSSVYDVLCCVVLCCALLLCLSSFCVLCTQCFQCLCCVMLVHKTQNEVKQSNKTTTKHNTTQHRHWKHWVHKTQNEDKQRSCVLNVSSVYVVLCCALLLFCCFVCLRSISYLLNVDSEHIEYTKHRTKTNKATKHNTTPHNTTQHIHLKHWVHKTQNEVCLRSVSCVLNVSRVYVVLCCALLLFCCFVCLRSVSCVLNAKQQNNNKAQHNTT
jgi:hypothetical protein